MDEKTKNKQIKIRFSQDMIDKLIAKATKEKRSISDIVREALIIAKTV